MNSCGRIATDSSQIEKAQQSYEESISIRKNRLGTFSSVEPQEEYICKGIRSPGLHCPLEDIVR